MGDAALGPLMFCVVGAVLVLGAIVGFVRQRAKFASWTRAEGAVVGHRARQSRRKNRVATYYHPLIRFVASGREHTFESPVSTPEPRRAQGSRVPVLFDPSNPESACIDEAREKYFVVMLLGAIGVVFSGVGALVALR